MHLKNEQYRFEKYLLNIHSTFFFKKTITFIKALIIRCTWDHEKTGNADHSNNRPT